MRKARPIWSGFECIQQQLLGLGYHGTSANSQLVFANSQALLNATISLMS